MVLWHLKQFHVLYDAISVNFKGFDISNLDYSLLDISKPFFQLAPLFHPSASSRGDVSCNTLSRCIVYQFLISGRKRILSETRQRTRHSQRKCLYFRYWWCYSILVIIATCRKDGDDLVPKTGILKFLLFLISIILVVINMAKKVFCLQPVSQMIVILMLFAFHVHEFL